jgi:NADH:ubiquinone oxidoreductase subunit 5 (subunit L)/multisubunit Na+/H+ antiporter MnhA subunit
LGLMFVALGMGAYASAMFHVTTHAFFKALLFLAAGSVIHGMGGEQDIRNMGGLRKAMPVTFWVFLIGTFAISGFPLLSGFFSKDEIFAFTWQHGGKLWWGLAGLGAMFTAIYMCRLLYVTFFGEFRGTAEQKHHLHESPAVMTVPLVILAALSVVGGFLNTPHFRLGRFGLIRDPDGRNAPRPQHRVVADDFHNLAGGRDYRRVVFCVWQKIKPADTGRRTNRPHARDCEQVLCG